MPKKTSATTIKDDHILADILGELQDKPIEGASSSNGVADKSQKVIAPARIVSNHTKKSDAAVAKEYMNSFMNNIKMKESSKKARDKENSDDELLDSLLKSKHSETNKPHEVKSVDVKNQDTKVEDKENTKDHLIIQSASLSEETETASVLSHIAEAPDDDMDFSCLQDDENQFEIEKNSLSSSAKKSDNSTSKTSIAHPKEDMQKLLSNWENICQMDNFEEELKSCPNSIAPNTDESLTANENLRFWYWEAWEDSLRRPGEVFLFGRTMEGKSICVRVENIERVIYLLPREYVS